MRKEKEGMKREGKLERKTVVREEKNRRKGERNKEIIGIL